MSDNNPNEIGDEELIYRRIPVSSEHYDSETDDLDEEAFLPHKTNDQTGLSVSRGQSVEHPDFHTIEKTAASGPSRKGYYVVVMRAGDIRAAGIEIVPAPIDGNPGHAELPQLRSENRRAVESQLSMRKLADRRLRVEGPFRRGG